MSLFYLKWTTLFLISLFLFALLRIRWLKEQKMCDSWGWSNIGSWEANDRKAWKRKQENENPKRLPKDTWASTIIVGPIHSNYLRCTTTSRGQHVTLVRLLLYVSLSVRISHHSSLLLLISIFQASRVLHEGITHSIYRYTLLIFIIYTRDYSTLVIWLHLV